VTGSSSGIGVETLRAFASKGARVFAAVRDVEKTKILLDEINAAYPNNGGLEILRVELDSLASVNAAADDFLKRSSQLNILVNNAGVCLFHFLHHLHILLSFSFSFSSSLFFLGYEYSLLVYQRWP
jgi:NAD(P)-dependent dehydrogenase (short-subunit alcohol dehydrogenase family)